jgi:adenylate cyclase
LRINLSPKSKRNFKKIILFGIIWFVYSTVYILIEKGLLGETKFYPSTRNVYDFFAALMVTPISAFIAGMILGTAETIYLRDLFSSRSYGTKLILKTLLYIFAIIIFLTSVSVIGNSIRLDLPLYDSRVLNTIGQFISNFAFWSIVIYIGSIISISLFISEVSDNIGIESMKNFFTGKYHSPLQEERIFMFLDMNSSTSIAENIGHKKYFKLLNMYYGDLSDGIVQTYGEIYQYAGDEVVVTWETKAKYNKDNCIKCLLLIREILDKNSHKYLKEFGLVPGFKAGFHYGQVTTGEIGVIKKEIIFTGDVLNTASRIQGMCKNFNVDNLFSEDLVNIIQPKQKYTFKEMGEFELRGKDAKVRLYSI